MAEDLQPGLAFSPRGRLFNLLGGEQHALGSAAWITRLRGRLFAALHLLERAGGTSAPRLICRGKLIAFV